MFDVIMNRRKSILTLALFATLTLFTTFALLGTAFVGGRALAADKEGDDDNRDKYEVGETYREKVDNLHPTQLRVGYHAVAEKKEKIEEMSKSDRKEHLRKNPIPVVLGPNNVLYIVDHHHLARAVYEADHQKVFIKIMKDWSKFDEKEFWKKMIAANYTYLHDTVTQRDYVPEDLPTHVWSMKDDPYRSLAGDLRDEDFYQKKESEFFIEFAWAEALYDFYKKKKVDVFKEKYSELLDMARDFAASDEAKNLPGRNDHHCALFLKK